jgi:hypothetical protein
MKMTIEYIRYSDLKNTSLRKINQWLLDNNIKHAWVGWNPCFDNDMSDLDIELQIEWGIMCGDYEDDPKFIELSRNDYMRFKLTL